MCAVCAHGQRAVAQQCSVSNSVRESTCLQCVLSRTACCRPTGLPSVFAACACLQLSESFVSFLERLVVVLVEHYPRLAPSSMGPVCHKVILLVLIALAGKGPILQSFVSHVGQ